jgi:pimeloyl-ACP methyl ester carboxylesterase
MKYFYLVLKVLLAIPLALFALAVALGGAYLQALSLLLVIAALFYWPLFRTRKRMALAARVGFIGLLLILQFTAFKGEPKQSIYLSDELQDELYSVYTAHLAYWPDRTEQLYVDTDYGRVHVLAYGAKDLPPILLFHAASMGAHSWAENLAPLLGHYRIYAIDNIGEGNLSELDDALVYPKSSEEIADLYAAIATELGVQQSPVLGASNGGYIAQVYAYYYPERVTSLALFGPMGILPLSAKSIFMLSAASLYPLDGVRNRVAHWAFGDDPYCHERYGDWFDVILRGTIPSVAQPQAMTTAQKKRMTLPVLLFLGTADPIVGDAVTARQAAEDYPNIEIHTLDSGHLIAIEHRDEVNQALTAFLGL